MEIPDDGYEEKRPIRTRKIKEALTIVSSGPLATVSKSDAMAMDVVVVCSLAAAPPHDNVKGLSSDIGATLD